MHLSTQNPVLLANLPRAANRFEVTAFTVNLWPGREPNIDTNCIAELVQEGKDTAVIGAWSAIIRGADVEAIDRVDGGRSPIPALLSGIYRHLIVRGVFPAGNLQGGTQ